MKSGRGSIEGESGSGSVSEREGKEGYKVCAQVKMEENDTGKVVVMVVDGEEEENGGGRVGW